MPEERHVVDIVHLHDVPAIEIRVAAPPAEIIPVIYPCQEGSVAAVINCVRPRMLLGT